MLMKLTAGNISSRPEIKSTKLFNSLVEILKFLKISWPLRLNIFSVMKFHFSVLTIYEM